MNQDFVPQLKNFSNEAEVYSVAGPKALVSRDMALNLWSDVQITAHRDASAIEVMSLFRGTYAWDRAMECAAEYDCRFYEICGYIYNGLQRRFMYYVRVQREDLVVTQPILLSDDDEHPCGTPPDSPETVYMLNRCVKHAIDLTESDCE